MKRALIIFSVTTILLTALNAVAAESAKMVVENIKTRGARAVVGRMYGSADWEQVMGLIARGDSEWLEVARLLSSGADGASAEELTIAAGEALETNASQALQVLWASYDPGMCQFIPDRDDPRYKTKQKAMTHLAARIKNLQAVNRPELFGARDSCINELRTWKHEIDQIYAN